MHDDTMATEPALQPFPLQRARAVIAPQFPRCRPVPLKREDLDTHEDRFEYWDGDTETAWVVREPTGIAHEQPSQRLAGLVQVIAGVRDLPSSASARWTSCFATNGGSGGESCRRTRLSTCDQSVPGCRSPHPW